MRREAEDEESSGVSRPRSGPPSPSPPSRLWADDEEALGVFPPDREKGGGTGGST